MDKSVDLSCRRNRVGGQAVIEGVMMKNGSDVALAVRKEDGSVEIQKSKFVALKTKHKWLNIPILRGIIGFVESLLLSFKTLSQATDMLGIEEDEAKEKAQKIEKKREKKREKLRQKGMSEEEIMALYPKEEPKEEEKKPQKSGGGLTGFIMVISMLLGIVLAAGLFIYLPSLAARFVFNIFELENIGGAVYLFSAIEGAVKVLIFIAYLALVSLMKDIRRVFQYHGAEHKSIACFESGMDLTPENARKCTRFHPRCGTSFMFVMILLGIIVGMFIPTWEVVWLRSVIKIGILPLVMGLGYEFIMIAGKHENWLTKALSAPGLWMQRITTKEPDEYQLAIAICAIKASMPEEFPDFDPSEYKITRAQNKGHLCIMGEVTEDEPETEEEPLEKTEEVTENAVDNENTNTEE